MYAAAGGYAECCRVLVDNGASVAAKSVIEGDTPLLKAVREGHLDVVQLLLERGANPNDPNRSLMSPKLLADKMRRLDIAAVLGGGGGGAGGH